MSDHLIPVTPEQLARLPDGVRVAWPDLDTWLRGTLSTDGPHRCIVQGRGRPDVALVWVVAPHLDMNDTVTRAVAASIARALLVRPPRWAANTAGMPSTDVRRALELAERMAPMSPNQIATLDRLARAALDALTPPEPPPPPPR